MSIDIEREVKQAVTQVGLGSGETILVGLSGGIDSQVLTAALVAARCRGSGPSVHAVHVNHRLRLEADQDAAQMVMIAAEFGVPLEVVVVDVAAWDRVLGEGLESAARAARYAAFARVARVRGAAWVAVGHTEDDQAETVLLHLSRGAALGGLGGMRPASRRSVPLDPGGEDSQAIGVLRPLLGVRRADVERYARERGLTPVEDRTNLSVVFRRNALRHRAIPLLESIAPGATAAIARTAVFLRDDAAYLDAMAQAAAGRVLGEIADLVSIERAGFRDCHVAIQRRLLTQAISRARGGSARITGERIEALRSATAEGRVSTQFDIGHGLTAYVDYGAVVLGAPEELQAALQRASGLPLIAPGVDLPLVGVLEIPADNGWRLRVEATSAGWRIRTRQPGDRIVVVSGRSALLQDWLVNRRVPSYVRERLPLLERDGFVRWVGGVAGPSFRDDEAGIRIELTREVTGDG